MSNNSSVKGAVLNVGFPGIDAVLQEAMERRDALRHQVFNDRVNEVYAEGVEAYKALKLRSYCPYESDTHFGERIIWQVGFDDAHDGSVRP